VCLPEHVGLVEAWNNDRQQRLHPTIPDGDPIDAAVSACVS